MLFLLLRAKASDPALPIVMLPSLTPEVRMDELSEPSRRWLIECSSPDRVEGIAVESEDDLDPSLIRGKVRRRCAAPSDPLELLVLCRRSSGELEGPASGLVYILCRVASPALLILLAVIEPERDTLGDGTCSPVPSTERMRESWELSETELCVRARSLM